MKPQPKLSAATVHLARRRLYKRIEDLDKAKIDIEVELIGLQERCPHVRTVHYSPTPYDSASTSCQDCGKEL